MAAVVETVKCNQCLKLIPITEARKFGLGNPADGFTCVYCRVDQINAYSALQEGLEVFASNRPIEEVKCRECQWTFEQLRALNGGESPRFFGHFKDGEYQLLCQACSDEFARKATELYWGTKFESEKKLRGAK